MIETRGYTEAQPEKKLNDSLSARKSSSRFPGQKLDNARRVPVSARVGPRTVGRKLLKNMIYPPSGE